MTSTIPVVFALDANYAVHTGIAMLSILLRAREPVRFCFYILEGNQPLTEEVRQQYQTVVDSHGARLHWLRVDSAYLDTLPRGKDNHAGLTSATHYRIYVADLLPDIDRCIYLDGDVVAMDDLALLWDGEEMDGFSVAAVHRHAPPAKVLALYPHLRGYFNAGVLLMNLRYWREHDLTRLYLEYTHNPANMQYCTNQDVLNGVCANSAKALHPRWNWIFDLRDYKFPPGSEKETATPGLVHYVHRKPWNNFDMKHAHAMEYWKVREKSPWWDPAKAREIWRRVRWGRWKVRLRDCRFSFNLKKGRHRIALFGFYFLDVNRSKY